MVKNDNEAVARSLFSAHGQIAVGRIGSAEKWQKMTGAKNWQWRDTKT
jgi:hypothetical protein